ncbi:MAG TPA: hypothetical protein GX714_10635 [Chloroflexi bacterium]|jgi:hypothetical protein|nr:hypothetical protein [Chloroflexota bacterium]
MYRKVLVSIALAIVLLAGAAGVALGQDTPETAQPLVGDTPASGTITGSNAGAFGYHIIDYPGGDIVVRIVASFAPGDPATLAGVGFNVYGPAGFDVGESVPTGEEDGREELSHSEPDATRWLVQVYNYIDGLTVSYTITADGLPAPEATPTPQPTPEGTPTPPPAEVPTPEAPTEGGIMALEASASGALTGSSAGAFDRYTLSYPGDNSEVTLTMTFAPDDAIISPGVGFTIYGPEGQEFVAGATGDGSERRVTLASEVAGTYLVQVHNYIGGVTINYTITR